MRILFASMPFDGHFMPLTGLADHLRRMDMTPASTRARATPGACRVELPHLPFRRATEINGENIAEHFPEVERLKGSRRIAFDLEKIFFGNTEAHFADIRDSARSSRSRRWSPTAPSTPPTSSPGSSGSRSTASGRTDARLRHHPRHRRRSSVSRRRPDRSPGPSTASSARWWRTPRNPAWRRSTSLLAREGLPPYTRSVFDLPVRRRRRSSSRPACPRWTSLAATGRPTTGSSARSCRRARRAGRAPVRRPARPLPLDGRGLAGDGRQPRPRKVLVPALTALAGGSHLVVACTGRRIRTPCERASRTTTSSSRTGSTSTRSCRARTSSSATVATGASCRR